MEKFRVIISFYYPYSCFIFNSLTEALSDRLIKVKCEGKVNSFLFNFTIIRITIMIFS